MENVSCWEKEMADKCDVRGVFFFDAPDEVMIERILKRGEESGRSDDTEETIKKTAGNKQVYIYMEGA